MGKPKVNIRGQKYGRLTALHPMEGLGTEGRVMWMCQCDCGIRLIRDSNKLRTGNTKSCGCLISERTAERNQTHNQSYTNTYRIYHAMITRTRNPNTTAWKRYGGRGIRVCYRWLSSFETFRRDMGDCPPGYSIDRIDNDGNYEPSNCRWIPLAENSRKGARKL